MNIVLAHGILGFDQTLGVNYFNGIKKHLEDKHHAKVLTTKVSPTGSIKTRGEELKKQILEGLNNGVDSPKLNPGDETHIIAHSMGGLDSRYILSPDNKDNIAHLITSLTTIGTPHRGSPIADIVYLGFDGKAHLSVTEFMEKQIVGYFKLLGISIEGLKNLTTQAMKQFNSDYKDNSNVKYFWTAGIGRKRGNRKTSRPFSPTYEYIYANGEKSEDRENDGVVPLSSANWDKWGGEQIGSLWNADHAEEIGHDLDKYLSLSGAFTVLAGALGHNSDKELPEGLLDRYDEIITRLSLLKRPEQ